MAGRSVVSRGAEKPGPGERIHLRPDEDADNFEDLRYRREASREAHRLALENLLTEVR